ncbi:MAG: ferredoxin:glutaredoxin reductase [Candidatus Methanoperedens sp.]|jgi:ferredoxin-thioredoxin reductase catalytic subunit|nr:ferredoxin:glutaredoxin reductase [Candidatus Methanoperedens sp.]PKL54195.1 MAG: ferredoxin:glutaredoxin reductase [Candidatus Methanoperedenaceae archaeon HGW-Methanoperedenaceae-1]
MRTIEEMFLEMKKIADEEGYMFTPNKEELDSILAGLRENEQRYGYPLCPCRIGSGELAKDMDIICPCNYRDADIAEFGSCLCTLYVGGEWGNTKAHEPVPERRAQENFIKGYQAIMEQKGAGGKDMAEVYRCTVCGYLCARDEPPELCPICRAKKERFEKFGMK